MVDTNKAQISRESVMTTEEVKDDLRETMNAHDSTNQNHGYHRCSLCGFETEPCEIHLLCKSALTEIERLETMCAAFKDDGDSES